MVVECYLSCLIATSNLQEAVELINAFSKQGDPGSFLNFLIYYISHDSESYFDALNFDNSAVVNSLKYDLLRKLFAWISLHPDFASTYDSLYVKSIIFLHTKS